MNALQLDFQGIVGSPSLSRVTRNALREPPTMTVSNAVPNETKLHDMRTIYIYMSILQAVR